jgi:hypothetical protein
MLKPHARTSSEQHIFQYSSYVFAVDVGDTILVKQDSSANKPSDVYV